MIDKQAEWVQARNRESKNRKLIALLETRERRHRRQLKLIPQELS